MLRQEKIKERVLEAAKIVQGAMKLAGSVQSLDPDIQQNIKKKKHILKRNCRYGS